MARPQESLTRTPTNDELRELRRRAAARGIPRRDHHYNFMIPFDAALMRGGAAGTAGLFLLGVVVLLVLSLRAHNGPASQRLGVRAGVTVLLIGCAIGYRSLMGRMRRTSGIER
jgi:hypothetical protein